MSWLKCLLSGPNHFVCLFYEIYDLNDYKRFCYILYYFSGLLTGRFKRAEVLDPTKTRIGLIDKFGAMGTSFPVWRNYSNNDGYWNIMEEMNNIAESHGK